MAVKNKFKTCYAVIVIVWETYVNIIFLYIKAVYQNLWKRNIISLNYFRNDVNIYIFKEKVDRKCKKV